jgi:hypothetical protein
LAAHRTNSPANRRTFTTVLRQIQLSLHRAHEVAVPETTMGLCKPAALAIAVALLLGGIMAVASWAPD